MTVLVILLIWGPINHSWPAWLAIRLAYLFLIPFALSFLLKWLWHFWLPSEKTELNLERILYGLIGVALITIGVFQATAETHWGNTHWIQTHDGADPVGDDIIIPGPDYFMAIILGAAGLLVVWFGTIKKGAHKK